jgi:enterochelin esterase-like enzyme
MPRFRPVLLFLLSLALTACTTASAASVGDHGVAHAARGEPPTSTPPPTSYVPTLPPEWTPTSRPPRPSPTRPPVPEALFTPTFTPAPCTETQGTITQVSIPSDTLNYPIDARIYLPPCYATSDQRYPVLYLIHGLNFKEDQWERLGAPAAADALAASGEIAPLIIVMPRDRLDDRLDYAFVNDLVPYVDANYRTLADRKYRAIGGLSRGAGWAVHIGLQFPAVFSRIGMHSPAVFNGDENHILQWTHHLPPDQVPAIYVDIGEDDSLVPSAVWLDQVFTWFKVKHTFIMQPGAHSEKYWSAHVSEYLRFYAADWRTPTASPTPDVDSPETP